MRFSLLSQRALRIKTKFDGNTCFFPVNVLVSLGADIAASRDFSIFDIFYPCYVGSVPSTAPDRENKWMYHVAVFSSHY